MSRRSGLKLSAAVDDRARPDFTVTWGEDAEFSNEPPDGIVLARMTLAGGASFVHVRMRVGYALRFPSICEFRVDCKRGSITVHPAPRADPGLVPLLLAGNVAGFLLGLAGDEPMRQQFRAHAHAAEIVPVFAATIPWGRPHSPRLRAALLRGLEECGV